MVVKGIAPVMRSAISGCGRTPDNGADVSVALNGEIACAVPVPTRSYFVEIAKNLE